MGYDPELHSKTLSACKYFKTKATMTLVYSVLFINNMQTIASTLVKLRFSKPHTSQIVKIRSSKKREDKGDLTLTLKAIWLREKSFTEYFIYLLIQSKGIYLGRKLYIKLIKQSKPSFPVQG